MISFKVKKRETEICVSRERGGPIPFSSVSAMLFLFLFLPAAKPSDLRTVRVVVVVVVVVVVGGVVWFLHYLNILALSSAVIAT